MPAKGTTKLTGKQRQHIAKNKLLGVTAKITARELGLAEVTIRRASIDQRTLALMAGMKQMYQPDIISHFKAGLELVGKVIRSKQETTADRLRAFGHIVNVAVAGEQKIEVDTRKPMHYTFEELLGAYYHKLGGKKL